MKSRSIRRVLFYLLLAGSLAGFFTWLLHVPRRPERLLRAVPVHADYLSIHPNLADQWAGLSANPIFRSVLGGMGFGKDELDAAASDPGFQTWMRMLASDTLVLFRADNWRPGERRPVWCAASLLGGRSQRLRWLLKAGRIPGFERAGEYQGRILWRWQSRDLPPGADLYLAFEEGLVLACLTDRASDLAALLSSYDGTSPSCDFSAMGLNWDQLPPMTGRVRSGLDWEFRVDEIGSDRLAARLICRTPLPPLTPVRTPAPPEWISVAADGFIWLSSDALSQWVAPILSKTGQRILAEIDPLRGPVIGLGLYGGDLSGRIQGLRIPALIMATPVTDEAEVSEKIRQTVDSLNANFQAGLIAGTENAHGLTIHVLEGSLDGDYARLAPEERAGYALADGWLLVASHATTLRTLAARQPTAPGETPEASPASRIGGGWLDLTRGGKTLRAALAAFSLKMSMSGDLDDETRLWIRQARDWIQSLEPLGRVDVELEQEGPTVRLHLTARPCEKETL